MKAVVAFRGVTRWVNLSNLQPTPQSMASMVTREVPLGRLGKDLHAEGCAGALARLGTGNISSPLRGRHYGVGSQG
jgi:hypothetical protein